MQRVFALATFVVSLLTTSASWAVCGCSEMSLFKTTGESKILCSDQNLVLDECTKRQGAARTQCTTTYEYACPVGVNSQHLGGAMPSQKTGFVIVADTRGNSSQCTSGQMLAMTITSNGDQAENPYINPTNAPGAAGQLKPGVTFTLDNNAAHRFPPYPLGGGTATKPRLGGDNYRWADKATSLIERSAAGFKWWDNTDQEKDEGPGENATWRYRFVAFVKGSSVAQTSCACAFDVLINWPSNHVPETRYEKVLGLSTRCIY